MRERSAPDRTQERVVALEEVGRRQLLLGEGLEDGSRAARAELGASDAEGLLAALDFGEGEGLATVRVRGGEGRNRVVRDGRDVGALTGHREGIDVEGEAGRRGCREGKIRRTDDELSGCRGGCHVSDP